MVTIVRRLSFVVYVGRFRLCAHESGMPPGVTGALRSVRRTGYPAADFRGIRGIRRCESSAGMLGQDAPRQRLAVRGNIPVAALSSIARVAITLPRRAEGSSGSAATGM